MFETVLSSNSIVTVYWVHCFLLSLCWISKLLLNGITFFVYCLYFTLIACCWCQESKTELLSKVTLGTSKSTEEDNATVDLIEERTLDFEDEMTSDQIPTFALYENSQIRDNRDTSVSSLLEYESSNLDQQNRAMVNGELESPVSSRKNAVARKDEGRGSSVPVEQFDFGPKSQDYGPQKVKLCHLLSFFPGLLYMRNAYNCCNYLCCIII